MRLKQFLIICMLSMIGAAYAACPTPTGNYVFQGHVGYNLRYSYASPVSYGAYSLKDTAYNSASTTKTLTLSTTLKKSTDFGAKLEALFGKKDETSTSTVSVSVSTPAYKTAKLEVRPESKYQYYTYDLKCKWLNVDTNVTSYTLYGTGYSTSEFKKWDAYKAYY